jgi:kynureninase
MQFQNDKSFARQLDQDDPLAYCRNLFILPERDNLPLIYFLGNSLGLQPKTANEYIQRIMKDWASLGVESFFHAPEPWMDYHNLLTKPLAEVVGARPEEVVVMNQLTVNLHLILVSFYKPVGKRHKIICEAKAFPSDQYMFETHVQHYGYDASDAVIEIKPRTGEYTLRTEDILATINEHAEETALVLFGGINYYTGQFFDIPAITKAAKAVGAIAGFDLAHAAGNVQLQLHKWEVDFACWCSYKYLNAGPGAIGGVFIHQKHHLQNRSRFAGWWGYDKPTRFKMEKGFVPMPGAEGWQLSTPAMFLYAAHRASLEIVEKAGWENIVKKAQLLNSYLWYMLQQMLSKKTKKHIEFITPWQPEQRGCQLSMLMLHNGKAVYKGLMDAGIMVDWREPDVIRLAPVSLYNTFEEIWVFTHTLDRLLE